MVVRVISGAVGAAVVLALLTLPPPAPLVLFTAVWVAAVWELGRLEHASWRGIALVLLLHLAILLIANLTLAQLRELVLEHLRFFLVALYSAVGVAQLLLGDAALQGRLAGQARVLNFQWHSFVFIALPLWLLWVESSFDPLMVVFVLGMAWASDTGAMLAGKLCGRCKVTPRISPGKTLEGIVGGWVALTAFILLAKLLVSSLLGHPFSGMFLWRLDPALVACSVVALIAVWLTVVGFIGDITFSAVKRAAGVKDFGTLIPGHGGVLDRIDALLFMVPWFFVILVLFTDFIFL